MPQSRARSAASRWFIALALIAPAIGCATSVRRIGPGDALQPNEGLLVLHVRTDAPLRSLSIGSGDVPFAVGAGTHLRLFAVTPGRYRWFGLEVPANSNDPQGSQTVRVRFRDPDYKLLFSVEPGRINYAGMLEIQGGYYRLVDRPA